MTGRPSSQGRVGLAFRGAKRTALREVGRRYGNTEVKRKRWGGSWYGFARKNHSRREKRRAAIRHSEMAAVLRETAAGMQLIVIMDAVLEVSDEFGSSSRAS